MLGNLSGCLKKAMDIEWMLMPLLKGVLKRDIFVQGLLLKWQEKVLPSATTFADALHQARTAEEQEKQLGEMHHRSHLGRKESTE